jgi:hypothetical protein
MQVERGHRSRTGGALAEATLDALAADLTVPHARPLVDLDRDDYANLEIAEPRKRSDDLPTSQFEPVTVPFMRPDDVGDVEPTARTRKPRPSWSPTARIAAALVTIAIGFGLGAGVSLLLV